MNKAEFKAIAKRYYQGSLKSVTKEEFENALDELLEDELKLQREKLIKTSRKKFCELCTNDTWECPRNCYRLQELQKVMEE